MEGKRMGIGKDNIFRRKERGWGAGKGYIFRGKGRGWGI
jgi:hypothetical protein